MNTRRLALLAGSALLVPLALVVTAGPALAVPPSPTFGSHVASCAQISTGFTAEMNPSHHHGPDADDMTGMSC